MTKCAQTIISKSHCWCRDPCFPTSCPRCRHRAIHCGEDCAIESFCCSRWGTCLCRLVNNALGSISNFKSRNHWIQVDVEEVQCILTQSSATRVSLWKVCKVSASKPKSEYENHFITFIFLTWGLEKMLYVTIPFMMLLLTETLQDNKMEPNPCFFFQTYPDFNL